jgi:hypothetical protein
MRSANHVLVAIVLAAGASSAFGKLVPLGEFEPALRWQQVDGRWVQDPEMMLRERIGQILSSPRGDGVDDWKWRDSVEDQLAALGPAAAGFLQVQLDRRSGYAADALRVALFRLDHGNIDLRPMLEAWARKHLPASTADTLKIMRVLGPRAALPHHLFYILEAGERGSQTRQRRVVALAADGKVHDITDDAPLARFLGLELPPARTEAAREHAAELAALLATARHLTPYKTTADTRATAAAAHAALTAEGLTIDADVTFDSAGRVASVTTSRKVTAAPAAPVGLPDTRQPPPAMPE